MNQLSNVSLYDVKAYVRKAQNAVLNFSEMEAKVREATNNEPWGTPTSKMQQIADATNNYQQFHEIMPFVFRRFTEKSANEWRQIYKALTLLDYLVRNGSERVVDYARSHISVIEMLRHFGYIDSKGVDQGAAIRKRSEDLVLLLNSVDKLRAERRKARQLLVKTGAGASVSSSGTSRYSGASFNNPSISSGSGSNRRYGGLSSEEYRARQFGNEPVSRNTLHTSADSVNGTARSDDFDEYTVETSTSTSKPTKSAAAAEEDDDDFADFQSAPSQETKSQNANILDLFDVPVTHTTPVEAPSASAFVTPSSSEPHQPALSTQAPTPAPTQAPQTQAPKTDIFDSLWEASKTTLSKPAIQPSKASPAQAPTPTPAPAPTQASPSTQQPEIEDLLSF